MYAILRQGSHQYRVAPGDIIQVEKLEVEKGAEVELEEILAVKNGESLEIGAPRVAGATVKAKVLRNGRGNKVIVFKKRRRKGFARTHGHRQDFTELMITGLFRNGKAL